MDREELIQGQVEMARPVRSRVSWGAIFAGAAVTFTLWILLTALGAAIGLTIADVGEGAAQGVGIYSIVIGFVCLFVGGWVMSQCVADERKSEAVVYGLMLWGVFFIGIVWLGMGGLEFGMSTAAALSGTEPEGQAAAVEPAAAETAGAAWWSFGAIAVSILSAILGALAGSGPRSIFRSRRVVVPAHGVTR